jgi:hypothetical protein
VRTLSFFFFLTWVSSSCVLAQCPNNAVFLALEDEVRGYSLRANGSAPPCQLIQGANDGLGTARAIAVSKNGFLHIAQFLTNGTIDIFSPTANGNVAPTRSFSLPTNDLDGIAIDSKVNDFVASRRTFPPAVFVVPPGSSGPQLNAIVVSLPDLAFVGAVAIDADNNLLVGGYDATGACTIQTFATSRSLTSPPFIRTIRGPATGLFSNSSSFTTNNVSIAVDPSSDELFVYNVSDTGKTQVSVFASHASGNVRPVRVLSGAATGITGPGFIGAAKIALSSDGRLFVAEPNNRILVFAPGARGNVAPSQVIQDSSIGSTQVPQGGIAVRSCRCR